MNAVTADKQTPRNPWYREPWPWIIMSGPAIVVVAGVATAIIAFRGADGLVADDYYKQGLGINRQIARDEAALALGIAGEIRLDGETVRVTLRAAAKLPDRLALRFAHHSRASEDRIVYLARRGEGTYEAPLPQLQPGRWRTIVETAQWRVAAQLDTRAGQTATFTPGVR